MPALLNYRTTLPKPDDPEIYVPICERIARGEPQSTAAASAGIHEETLYHWRYKGQEELAGLGGVWKPWEELSPHAQLVIRVKEAEAQFVGTAVQNWWDAEQNWAKWPTLLERRRPQDFGRRTEVHVQSESVRINLYGVLPPQAQLALAQRQAELAEQRLLQEGKRD